MPIPFELIPRHLQIAVAEKLHFKAYANFEKTSKLSKKVANEIRKYLTVPLNLIHEYNSGEIKMEENGIISLLFYDPDAQKNVNYRYSPDVKFSFKFLLAEIFTVFDDAFCMAAIDFFVKTKSSAWHIYFREEEITCSPSNLETFLRVAGVSSFTGGGDWAPTLPIEYCRIPLMKEIENVQFHTQYLTDEDLLSYKAESILLKTFCRITDRGINQFIKEFLNGARKLNDVELHLEDPIDIETTFDGIHHEILSIGSEKTLIKFGTRKKTRWMSITYDLETSNQVVFIASKKLMEALK